jgi:ATP-dependent Clp protease ATP-binding subunit ClpX
VQTALLKLMEDTEVPLYPTNDIRAQMSFMFGMKRGEKPKREHISTRNILVIASGAFSGIDKIITKRVGTSAIGFMAEPKSADNEEHTLKNLRTQDLIAYGFEAEFVGRLPVRVVCESLTQDDLFHIQQNSEGSLIRQLEREFSAYNVHAKFTDDALRAIAAIAVEEKTGARGLVTAWEKVLRDFKFELPAMGLRTFTIDAALITDPARAMDACRQATLELNHGHDEAAQFASEFSQQHDVIIDFESEAKDALIHLAKHEQTTVHAVCRRLFKDYPFGLQLVARTQERHKFMLPLEAIEKPDHYLSALIAGSHR